MGKKSSLAEVLAEGKERLEASRSSSSSSPPVRDVPMNAKLPGGLTLKGFMKKNGVDYAEAAAIYKAYTADVEADELKIAKYGLPSAPVATPARAKGSKPALDDQVVEATGKKNVRRQRVRKLLLRARKQNPKPRMRLRKLLLQARSQNPKPRMRLRKRLLQARRPNPKPRMRLRKRLLQARSQNPKPRNLLRLSLRTPRQNLRL